MYSSLCDQWYTNKVVHRIDQKHVLHLQWGRWLQWTGEIHIHIHSYKWKWRSTCRKWPQTPCHNYANKLRRLCNPMWPPLKFWVRKLDDSWIVPPANFKRLQDLVQLKALHKIASVQLSFTSFCKHIHWTLCWVTHHLNAEGNHEIFLSLQDETSKQGPEIQVKTRGAEHKCPPMNHWAEHTPSLQGNPQNDHGPALLVFDLRLAPLNFAFTLLKSTKSLNNVSGDFTDLGSPPCSCCDGPETDDGWPYALPLCIRYWLPKFSPTPPPLDLWLFRSANPVPAFCGIPPILACCPVFHICGGFTVFQEYEGW